MIQALRAVVILLCCAPFASIGQPADHELPLPRAKGASMVVKMHYSFMLPLKGEMRSEKDTESVFLIAPDGYAHTRFFCDEGVCSGKECYEYRDGLLVRRSYYSSLDRHTVFALPYAHRHRLLYEDEWEYAHGKISLERHRVSEDKILTREIHYVYDERGRVDEIYYQYPRQSLVYYPSKYESVQYRYYDDTVCKLAYRAGRVCDSSYAVERYNREGLVTEISEASGDGRHFDRALNQYDSSGRITVCESFSDRPAVQPDGVVLRADRVEYTYDEQGRPDEVRCFAKGIKRWAYKYSYLK